MPCSVPDTPQVSAAKRRYEVGLEKLQFTAGQVSIMQDELTALKPVLIKTVAETEVLMEKVSKEKTEVRLPQPTSRPGGCCSSAEDFGTWAKREWR